MTAASTVTIIVARELLAGDDAIVEGKEAGVTTTVAGPIRSVAYPRAGETYVVFEDGHGYHLNAPDDVSDDSTWVLVSATRTVPTEPEPEWKPGTLAEATVHGYPGIRVWRVEGGEPLNGWTTHVPVDDATWHADSDVTDVRPLVVLDPAATKCPDCGHGLFVALHDDEQWICRTCATGEMERLELENARPPKTVVRVTKAVTQEELADVLAQHYGDHENLAAVPEQSMRQNYLSDANSILDLLGGGTR